MSWSGRFAGWWTARSKTSARTRRRSISSDVVGEPLRGESQTRTLTRPGSPRSLASAVRFL